MYVTVNFNEFRTAFVAANRANQFSFSGLGYLFDYLEQYEEDTGKEMELDAISLCCEFVECTYDDILREYDTGINSAEYVDIDDRNSAIIDWLSDCTTICGYDDEIVVFNSEF